jgi:hypothetical protein
MSNAPTDKGKRRSGKTRTGRPTKYKKEFCDQLLKHMREGGSYESFAAVAGVSRDTLYDWEKAQPEFLYTKKRGVDLALLYYENVAKGGITGQLRRLASEEITIDPRTGEQKTVKKYAPATFGQAAFIFTMKNRFPDLFRERVEHTGANGGPMRYSNMSEEEIDRLMRQNAEDMIPSIRAEHGEE